MLRVHEEELVHLPNSITSADVSHLILVLVHEVLEYMIEILK